MEIHCVRSFNPVTDISRFVLLQNSLTHSNTHDEESVVAELHAPNHDCERDRWVAVVGSTSPEFVGFSVGYHTVPERYLAWLEVEAAHRRIGLGTALMAQVIKRAKHVYAKHVLVNADVRNDAARLFLRHMRFDHVSHSWFMSATQARLSTSETPPGYTLKKFSEIKDYQLLKDAYYGSCRDMWGNGANSIQREIDVRPIREDWQQWFTSNDPDGDGIIIAFAPDKTVAGICRGVVEASEADANHEKYGTVDALGAVPRHRSGQLLQALTSAVGTWLSSRGCTRFTLEAYGASEGTIQVYRELGFSLDRCDATYCLMLPN